MGSKALSIKSLQSKYPEAFVYAYRLWCQEECHTFITRLDELVSRIAIEYGIRFVPPRDKEFQTILLEEFRDPDCDWMFYLKDIPIYTASFRIRYPDMQELDKLAATFDCKRSELPCHYESELPELRPEVVWIYTQLDLVRIIDFSIGETLWREDIETAVKQMIATLRQRICDLVTRWIEANNPTLDRFIQRALQDNMRYTEDGYLVDPSAATKSASSKQQSKRKKKVAAATAVGNQSAIIEMANLYAELHRLKSSLDRQQKDVFKLRTRLKTVCKSPKDLKSLLKAEKKVKPVKSAT
jgi:hypothetical protein